MQVEGIYTAEPRFEAKAKALKLKQEMAAAAAEEQRAQKEKQYAQSNDNSKGKQCDHPVDLFSVQRCVLFHFIFPPHISHSWNPMLSILSGHLLL